MLPAVIPIIAGATVAETGIIAGATLVMATVTRKIVGIFTKKAPLDKVISVIANNPGKATAAAVVIGASVIAIRKYRSKAAKVAQAASQPDPDAEPALAQE